MQPHGRVPYSISALRRRVPEKLPARIHLRSCPDETAGHSIVPMYCIGQSAPLNRACDAAQAPRPLFATPRFKHLRRSLRMTSERVTSATSACRATSTRAFGSSRTDSTDLAATVQPPRRAPATSLQLTTLVTAFSLFGKALDHLVGDGSSRLAWP